MDTSLLPALGLGFLLGVTHALDADHVAAVGTLVSEAGGLRRSSLLGASWGLGHSASLLAAGLLVLGLRLAIPPRLSAAAEFGVGLMLVGLGGRAVRRVLREKRVHCPSTSTAASATCTSTPMPWPTRPATTTSTPSASSGGRS